MAVQLLEPPVVPLEDPAVEEAAVGDPSSPPAWTGEHSLPSAVAVYVAERPRLLRIAYRVLGSAVEAEDVVQEVWVRWQRTDRTLVTNPPAFLATITSRLAINVLHAARTRHEATVTPWLEDVADVTALVADDPVATAERADAARLAMRVLLERLTPAECAAYVLRNGFDYPYRTIAAVLHVSAANARQLVSRANVRLHSPRRQPVSVETHRRLVHAFVSAARAGELAPLEALLAARMRATASAGAGAGIGAILGA